MEQTPSPAPARRTQSRRSRLGRIAISLGILYVVLLVMLDVNQEWLLFSGRITQGPPPAVAPEPGSRLLQLHTPKGTRVTALFGPALNRDGSPRADAARCPTLLHFYGSGTCIQTDLWEFNAFRKLGCNVVIPDYVGYGWSGGSPTEAGCYATADAAYDYLLHAPGVDPRRIVASGTSLGGAMAIDLASRRPVAALITYSTFTSMAEMAQREYPFVPAGLLLRHRFESERKMPRVRCPVFLSHGTADLLIPFSMRDRLAGACGGPVTRYAVRGAGHNDFFARDAKGLLAAVSRFLQPLQVDALPGRTITSERMLQQP